MTPIEKLKELSDTDTIAKSCYLGYHTGHLTADEAVVKFMHSKTKEQKGTRNRLLREMQSSD